MAYYFSKLHPPRPTFVLDMNDEERALMGQHAMYWKGMLDAGQVIAFGPVADPSGGYGIGIMNVDSPEQLDQLQNGDPVIQAGRGFRYEAHPMLTAVHQAR